LFKVKAKCKSIEQIILDEGEPEEIIWGEWR